jgi:hypothetical protein
LGDFGITHKDEILGDDPNLCTNDCSHVDVLDRDEVLDRDSYIANLDAHTHKPGTHFECGLSRSRASETSECERGNSDCTNDSATNYLHV